MPGRKRIETGQLTFGLGTQRVEEELVRVHPALAIPGAVLRVDGDTMRGSRDLHDALKRRCLYHWIDYPDLDRAIRIVRMRVPEAPEPLVAQIAGAVEHLRLLPLQKPPGVAEAIDWVHAAELLGLNILNESTAQATLGSVLKYREDQELVRTPGMSWLPDA